MTYKVKITGTLDNKCMECLFSMDFDGNIGWVASMAVYWKWTLKDVWTEHGVGAENEVWTVQCQ